MGTQGSEITRLLLVRYCQTDRIPPSRLAHSPTTVAFHVPFSLPNLTTTTQIALLSLSLSHQCYAVQFPAATKYHLKAQHVRGPVRINSSKRPICLEEEEGGGGQWIVLIPAESVCYGWGSGRTMPDTDVECCVVRGAEVGVCL